MERIIKDEQGKEYIVVEYVYYSDSKIRFKEHEAFKLIKEDKADCFYLRLFKGIGVIRYLDRSYGERVRKKTLNSFKEERYKFYIGYYNEKRKHIKGFDGEFFYTMPKYFDTEEEARNYIPQAKELFTKGLLRIYNEKISDKIEIQNKIDLELKKCFNNIDVYSQYR